MSREGLPAAGLPFAERPINIFWSMKEMSQSRSNYSVPTYILSLNFRSHAEDDTPFPSLWLKSAASDCEQTLTTLLLFESSMIQIVHSMY